MAHDLEFKFNIQCFCMESAETYKRILAYEIAPPLIPELNGVLQLDGTKSFSQRLLEKLKENFVLERAYWNGFGKGGNQMGYTFGIIRKGGKKYTVKVQEPMVSEIIRPENNTLGVFKSEDENDIRQIETAVQEVYRTKLSRI